MLRQRISACLVPGMVAMTCFVAAYVAFWISDNFGSPYPLEFREDAIVGFSQLQAGGANPYSLTHRPVHVNVYGIGYHWIVYPVARLFGCTYQAHRGVSVFFIVASAGLLAWILRRDKVTWAFALTAGLLLFIHLGEGLSIVSRPDSFGLFLFLAGFLIPYRYAFSPASLVISVALSILAFLTKPYFLLSLALVPGYVFLRISKRRGILMALAAMGALALVVLVIDKVYECYFTETFFVMLSGASRSWRHLRNVGLSYATLNWGLLLILAGALLSEARRQRRDPPESAARETDSGWLNLADSRRPLLRTGLSLPGFVLICNVLVLVLLLGLHQGNGILYYHQFVTPFLLWLVFRQVDVKWNRPWPGILLILANVAWLSVKTPRLPGDYAAQWAALDQWVASHTNVFNAPHLAHILVKQNKRVYDTGQTECYPLATRKNFMSIAPAYEQKGRAYREQMTEDIRQQKFDLIAISPGISLLLPLRELRNNYLLEDTLAAPMAFDAYPIDTFPVDIWIPKKKSRETPP